jgi:hypothetical protein
MAKNKITDLRDHLFEAIEMLKDEESNMTVEKAEAIATLGQTIINSAKLEIDYIKVADKMTGLTPQNEFLTPKQLK